MRVKQLYLPNTNILITRFLSDDGICEVTDFMPVTGQPFHSHVVRKVAVITGEIEFTVECWPRFNYAQTPHRIERDGSAIIFTPEGIGSEVQPALVLNGHLALQPKTAASRSRFASEQKKPRCSPSVKTLRVPGSRSTTSVSFRFKEAARFWHDWSLKPTTAAGGANGGTFRSST